jgi:hypothetical protein
MPKDNWMKFINSVWTMMAYWEWIKLYRNSSERLPNTFCMRLAALAVRNELLMNIAHVVHVCEEIAKNHEIGSAAHAALKDIQVLYAKGDTPDRSILTFEDCGLKPFRDKVLAHPLNEIKATLGKPEYQISLKWKTIEDTIAKINKFCDHVEAHNRSEWQVTTYRGGDVGVDVGFSQIVHAVEAAEKLGRLTLEIAKKGHPRVHWDWSVDEIIIDE